MANLLICNCILVLVFIDLKKAFDKVDHKTLPKNVALWYPTAVTIVLLDTIVSKQIAFSTEDNSVGWMAPAQNKGLDVVAPQGSFLGPLLFLIHISVIRHKLSTVLLLHVCR